jgi:hypothetical protein
MNHTFLFLPGTWDAQGSYTSSGNTVKVTGKTTISHHENKWIINSSMKLESGTVIQNDYEVVPFKDSCISTTWVSTNPILGKLIGDFTLQNNQIIENYHTEDQAFEGKEIMTMLDDSNYTCEGTLHHKGNVKSSWSINLIKIK